VTAEISPTPWLRPLQPSGGAVESGQARLLYQSGDIAHRLAGGSLRDMGSPSAPGWAIEVSGIDEMLDVLVALKKMGRNRASDC